MGVPIVVLIHGAWLAPGSWDRFVERFEAVSMLHTLHSRSGDANRNHGGPKPRRQCGESVSCEFAGRSCLPSSNPRAPARPAVDPDGRSRA